MPESIECHIHGVQPAVRVVFWRRTSKDASPERREFDDCKACDDEMTAEVEAAEEDLRKRGLIPPKEKE